eukprot:Skav232133  [mRNA]  locus=scaffold1744:144304:147305:- [translate_table: standard]
MVRYYNPHESAIISLFRWRFTLTSSVFFMGEWWLYMITGLVVMVLMDLSVVDLPTGDPWKKRRLAQASKECPFGFYFLVAVQLTSAAHTQTFYMPPFSRVMDQVLQDISFFEAGARGHPLWRPGAVGIRSEGRLIVWG